MRISTPQRLRYGSSCVPAAASSEFTMRSALSTTGTGTKACSAMQIIATMARFRTVVKIVAADSSTSGISNFAFKDEWYNLEPFPTLVKFLATVDEDSLATRRTVHPGHGDFHPVAWCQYYDGGRSWVTTLGHDGAAFIDGSGFPGQQSFKRLIVNGILSAMGNIPFCQ